MVLTKEQIEVMKNNFLEKGLNDGKEVVGSLVLHQNKLPMTVSYCFVPEKKVLGPIFQLKKKVSQLKARL